jgi:UDP-N-acetyl-D-glucosamine dehydrogenase
LGLAVEPTSLEERFTRRTARVGVVGLGAVGLPTAAIFARAGFGVIGCDTDRAKLEVLARGESPLRHIPDRVVQELARGDRFTASADHAALAAADAVLLCLPTPLSAGGEPDLSAVRAATRALAPHLAPGALVVLESTTYPGTTRGVVGELLAAAGRTPGKDVFLAFSPERVDPGRGDPTGNALPKLVGGTCARSTELARALYAAAFEQVRLVSSAEVAEAAKLLENVFRAVNIALVNELKVALAAMGIDVWEVIEAAASKPFGFMKFTPGPGMGGHCIPVDPFYLSWVARQAGAEARFVELAGRINREMPGYVVERTREALASVGRELQGARVLLLGLAYKPEVDIVTESPALRLFELFGAAGAEVEYADPYVPVGPVAGEQDLSAKRAVEIAPGVLEGFDVVVVATDHAAFDWALIAQEARLVVDTRNALAGRMGGRGNYFKA